MHKPLNKNFTQEVGLIHFIGIGGIGMSGMAEILHNLGYRVQGSDLNESYITERLQKNGIKVIFGHHPQNIEGVSLIVKSTDIQDSNVEIKAAFKESIPVIKRCDMLAEIMRCKPAISVSGTHGKTTTTSMIATVFDGAQMNPTVINGGVINQFNTNAYVGDGDYIIAEADESDGTFIKIPSYIAVVTNIDPEHLNYYGTFANVKTAYKTFIENIPFYGFAVLCYDHPVVREIGAQIIDRRIIKYGVEADDLDIKAVNITQDQEGMAFDVIFSSNFMKRNRLNSQQIEGMKLRAYGQHNVLNCLSAIAIGIEKGISIALLQKSLANFRGVKRRFTQTGEVRGIRIIDDYAHHPEEIKVTLNAARMVANMRGGKVIAVMQPHRYTRLQSLMEEFAQSFDDADEIIISEVYSAGEQSIANITSEKLIEKIKQYSSQSVYKLDDPLKLAEKINKLAKSSDLVVLLGAGSITKWAYDLPQQLEKI
jgi:UDP-N-acetylmuramate--alanine ligase